MLEFRFGSSGGSFSLFNSCSIVNMSALSWRLGMFVEFRYRALRIDSLFSVFEKQIVLLMKF